MQIIENDTIENNVKVGFSMACMQNKMAAESVSFLTDGSMSW